MSLRNTYLSYYSFLFFSRHIVSFFFSLFSLRTVFIRVLFTHLIGVGIHFFPTCDGNVFSQIPSCKISIELTWTRNSQYLCRQFSIDCVFLLFPHQIVSIYLLHFPLTPLFLRLLKSSRRFYFPYMMWVFFFFFFATCQHECTLLHLIDTFNISPQSLLKFPLSVLKTLQLL